MKNSDFCHTHVHTHFSLQDGASTAAGLATAAKMAGHTALAITDHGSVSGVIDFWKACKEVEIQPIVGCEAYLAPGEQEDAQKVKGSVVKDGKKERYYHLTLLAKNPAGWKNLSKLATLASLDGLYYKPRICWDLLTKHSEGLIAMSGCLRGEIPQAILRGDKAEAERVARRWVDLLGEDFYIELMPDVVKGQGAVNTECIDIARRLGVRTVASADVHYVNKQDADIQEVKICISAGGKTLDENRASGLNMSPVFYYKSTEEMFSFFRRPAGWDRARPVLQVPVQERARRQVRRGGVVGEHGQARV